MCSRYSLVTPPEEVAHHFDLAEIIGMAPRYNIAPTDEIMTVVASESGRRCVSMRWGMTPVHGTAPLINARSETVSELPTFRESFQRRRCLIPADGFYEWKTVGRHKRPCHFSLRGGVPFGFAGIWDPPRDERSQPTCAILTTGANSLVGEVHDRMPAILRRDDLGLWLTEGASQADLLGHLRPVAARWMTMREVNQAVNNVRTEGPVCWLPPDPPIELDLFGE